MKKLLALLLAFLLPLTALAETNEDGDMVIALPGADVFFTPIDGVCLTRESSASEFNRAGLSQRELIPYMEQSDTYALIFDAAQTTEIQLMIWPAEDEDYDDLTEFGEALLVAEYRNAYLADGCDVSLAEIYHAYGGHTFLRMAFSFDDGMGGTIHTAQYMTCQDGYALMILIYPYVGQEMGQTQLDVGAELADSLWVRAK